MSKPLDQLDPESKALIRETQIQQVAHMLMAGNIVRDIAAATGLSTQQVNKMTAKDDFKAYLREYSEKMVATAANTWKGAMMERIPIALKALDKSLKAGDLEAVKIMMRTLGVDKLPEQSQQAQSLQIILPDYNNTKVVEVEKND